MLEFQDYFAHIRGMYYLGMIAGALVPAFLISRIFLWLLRKWNGGYTRIVAANAASAAVMSLVSAFGHADGGPLDWSFTAIYVSAQIFWLAIDVFLARRKRLATQ